MKLNTLLQCIVFFASCLFVAVANYDNSTAYAFWATVPFDVLEVHQQEVTKFTCQKNSKSWLRMPHGAIAQLPEFNTLSLAITFPNRTGLLHIHNMALNRAFFFSYILQRFNNSRTDFHNVPGLLYLYLSAASDVSANPKLINGSTLMYDVKMFYPNWFTTMPFNATLDLFAVRAMRVDDTFMSTNFLREPSMNSLVIQDLGAIPGENYTLPYYKNAPWYGLDANDPGFIPDNEAGSTTGAKKHIFNIEVEWSPTERSGWSFFGPPYPGVLETDLPVRFTQPWFDCGNSPRSFNDWIGSSVSPVVDFMPRYGKSPLLQRPTYVAVAAMDTYFMYIPVNLCPISVGNGEPNLIANSDRCHSSTTCESLLIEDGTVQFQSGTFKCRCDPGYHYSAYQEGDYDGLYVTVATQREYDLGYRCEKTNNLHLWPTVEGIEARGQEDITMVKLSRKKRNTKEDIEESRRNRVRYVETVFRKHHSNDSHKVLDGYNRSKSRKLSSTHTPEKSAQIRHKLSPRFKSQGHIVYVESSGGKLTSKHEFNIADTSQSIHFDRARHDRMEALFRRVDTINGDNCHRFSLTDLILPNTVSFGARKQFSNQASLALRLAHFLSAFLQLNKEDWVQVHGIKLGQSLHEQHVIGEVMASVAGDIDVTSVGVFFDRNAFIDSNNDRREFFGPLAFRHGSLDAGSFGVRDMANFNSGYHNKVWFTLLKERWATNFFGLQKFLIHNYMRSSPTVQVEESFPYGPMIFKAPSLEDGYWTEPFFDCEGPVKDWLLTYAVPFFGIVNGRLSFMGVATASVSLGNLNINQCPGKFYEANFFKDTAICDPVSTFCKPMFGLGFARGSYECHCRHGYEYPYFSDSYFYLGQMMEAENEKKMAGKPSIFDLLKCRRSSSSTFNSMEAAYLTVVITIVKFVLGT